MKYKRKSKSKPLSGCAEKEDAADCLDAYNALVSALDDTRKVQHQNVAVIKKKALDSNDQQLVTDFVSKCLATECEAECHALVGKLQSTDTAVPSAGDKAAFAETCRVESGGGNDNPGGGNDNPGGNNDAGSSDDASGDNDVGGDDKKGDASEISSRSSKCLILLVLAAVGFYFNG
jgi:hypothetical protein